MLSAIEKVKEVNHNSTVASKAVISNTTLFNYELQPPTDAVVTKKLWSDSTKSLLFNATQDMGIKNYTPTILKDDNIAIAKSQKHLIDLMKYYEGDRNYYYEAYTAPYKDRYGSYTCGFGELTNKNLTQEKAYENMCNNLKQFSKELRNLLNKKIGNNTYESLPSSIKEGLIDLCYNKGLGTISKNANLLNSIKSKDYSSVIANLAYVYSNKSGAQKVEDAGLYKRSLSRAILAARDLRGSELEQAKQEIDKLYNKAKVCHDKNNLRLNELNKIYGYFKSGKISAPAHSAESYKVKIDSSFKGKGSWGVAQSLYKSLGIKDIEFKDFYNQFLAINNGLKDVKVGQEVKVPYFNELVKNDSIKTVMLKEVVVDGKRIQKADLEEKVDKDDKTEKPGLFKRILNGIKKFFTKVGNLIKNLFTSKEDKSAFEGEPKTPFEKVLKYGTIVQDGDFQIITMDYEVKKGDNLWKLARTYGTSEDILCNDNNIKDKNCIDVGQNLKIRKLAYKVKEGDNLFRIAKKFGLSIEMLKDLNNIEDINKIFVEQMLEIPGFIYKVKANDTLSGIADRVGVDIEILKRINNLKDNNIKPNQNLKIVYNDSDFALSSDKKKVCFDSKTNTTKEVIDMRGTADLSKRPLLQKKRKINGQVMATRHVFNPDPTKHGSLSGKTIIINAGHGYSQAGTDCGATGIGKVEDEWLINYDNAMRLKDRLCAKGAKVIFLQGHVNVVTREIPKSENKADMFISVHVNSCAKKTQDRTQIYTYNKKSSVNNKSKKLSGLMEKNFDSWIPKHEKINNNDKFMLKQDDNKRVQDYAQSMEANYAVIRTAESSQKIPSVLWEVAFMISPKGRERMSNPSIMNNYSDIMVKSVEQYFN